MVAPKKYPDELRERAIRMVLDLRRDPLTSRGALGRVGQQLGITEDTLRGWVSRAKIDSALRPGVTSEEQRRIDQLEREVRELRRVSKILKSAFFAAEFDRPHWP